MKTNCQTRITGRNVVLVPYRKIHVPKYHCWMQSTELQELTASEPLTENEEFIMQQTWMEDENKCTFIVLEKEVYEDKLNEVDAMIGDTNLYLFEDNGVLTAETGIMIADYSMRGKGRGKEALMLMMQYGVKYLKVKNFLAKISLSNVTSIVMFKKLGFKVESESSVFQEITLAANVCPSWISWLEDQTQHMRVELEVESDVR